MPPVLDFGKVPVGERKQREITIAGLQGRRLQATSVSASDDVFTAEIDEKSREWASTKVKVTFMASKTGSHRGQLEIHSEAIGPDSIQVPLSATGIGDVTVLPEKVILIARNGEAQAATRYVSVRGRPGGSLAIESVIPPAADVDVLIRSVAKNVYLIQLGNLRASAEVNGKNIKIVTNSENAREMNVPIQVMTMVEHPPRHTLKAVPRSTCVGPR